MSCAEESPLTLVNDMWDNGNKVFQVGTILVKVDRNGSNDLFTINTQCTDDYMVTGCHRYSSNQVQNFHVMLKPKVMNRLLNTVGYGSAQTGMVDLHIWNLVKNEIINFKLFVYRPKKLAIVDIKSVKN